jgi:hypothetical protein
MPEGVLSIDPHSAQPRSAWMHRLLVQALSPPPAPAGLYPQGPAYVSRSEALPGGRPTIHPVLPRGFT